MSEIEQVRFLIRTQRVRKYCTKDFLCGVVFIIIICTEIKLEGS